MVEWEIEIKHHNIYNSEREIRRWRMLRVVACSLWLGKYDLMKSRRRTVLIVHSSIRCIHSSGSHNMQNLQRNSKPEALKVRRISSWCSSSWRSSSWRTSSSSSSWRSSSNRGKCNSSKCNSSRNYSGLNLSSRRSGPRRLLFSSSKRQSRQST